MCTGKNGNYQYFNWISESDSSISNTACMKVHVDAASLLIVKDPVTKATGCRLSLLQK